MIELWAGGLPPAFFVGTYRGNAGGKPPAHMKNGAPTLARRFLFSSFSSAFDLL